jgi:hypothetical protein
MCELKVKPLGIRTDSLLFKSKYEKIIKKNFDMRDMIGSYKIEYNKEMPMTLLEKFESPYPDTVEIMRKTHDIKDEWDTKEINKVISDNKKMLILGDLPGVGKTTAARNYESKSKLFVCPYNKLCLSMKKVNLDSITLCKLLGLGIGEFEPKQTKKISFNVAAYDTIIFDEIFLCPPADLHKIHKFMERNPEKTYIATGDTHQNAPVGIDTLNIFNSKVYLDECMSHLFPNQIVLKKNKRLKNPKDIEKLINLKVDIFNNNIDIMTTIKKYGLKIITKMSELKTKTNVCFFNFQCAKVNNYVHNNLVKIDEKVKTVLYKYTEYYKGLELTCHTRHKVKNAILQKNYSYIITKLSSKYFTVVEPVESFSMTFPIDMITKHFKLSYADTNHAVQGMTITDPFTIFDANTPYINRNWIWTALTRTDDLKKITIFEHDKATINRLTASKMEQYFRIKIANYKSQDTKAGRVIDKENFVTTEWIRQCFFHQNKECCICKCPLEFEVTDGSVLSNLTVDRQDNSIAHTVKNCKLSCVKCNTSRR